MFSLKRGMFLKNYTVFSQGFWFKDNPKSFLAPQQRKGLDPSGKITGTFRGTHRVHSSLVDTRHPNPENPVLGGVGEEFLFFGDAKNYLSWKNTRCTAGFAASFPQVFGDT